MLQLLQRLVRFPQYVGVAAAHLQANPAWAGHLLHRWRSGSRMVLVVGTAHRVGSTWLFRLLRDLGFLRNAIIEAPAHLRRYGALWPGQIDYRWLSGLGGWAILKGHADPPVTAVEAALAHFITLTRDPRDVLVSASFYYASQPVEMGGYDSAFRALTPAERIVEILQNPRNPLLDELEAWFQTPFATRICYEELYASPVETLLGLSARLEWPVNCAQVEAIVKRHQASQQSGPGKWRRYFDDKTIAQFKSAQSGRWNKLTIEMGYKTGIEW